MRPARQDAFSYRFTHAIARRITLVMCNIFIFLNIITTGSLATPKYYCGF